MKLSFVTLGARDLTLLRRFYAAWGWSELPDSSDDWAGFDAGGTRLALYPMALLGDEAAPGAEPPPPGRWNGTTLAMNVMSLDQVTEAYHAAIEGGATAIAEPQPRSWGGHSGYVADPEGNRWEIAWAPGLDPSPGGFLRAVDAVTVKVPDVDAGLRFYRDVLGHHLHWRNEEIGVDQAGLKVPDADTEIVLTTKHGYEPNWLVESVQSAVGAFRDNGGTVLAEPVDIPVGQVAVVADPFGNVLVLLDLPKGLYTTDATGRVTGVDPDARAAAAGR